MISHEDYWPLTSGRTRLKAKVDMTNLIPRPIAVMSFGISAWCAGPQLTSYQIQDAIMEGRRYKIGIVTAADKDPTLDTPELVVLLSRSDP